MTRSKSRAPSGAQESNGFHHEERVERATGRVALVVGGSGGIGSAIALGLKESGARIAVTYLTGAERAQSVAMEIGSIGGEGLALPADVRTEEGCCRLVDSILSRWGDIDILVYAAGTDLWKPALDTTGEEWRALHAVNIEGAFHISKAVLPRMLAKGWGRIVYVGSVWGEAGAAAEVAYSATKAGLVGLTRSLAKEVALSGVTVNVVSPGVIDTAMNDRFDEEERKELLARIPVGRLGAGRDVAQAVRFLVSDDAAYITGHVLQVTGGFDPLP